MEGGPPYTCLMVDGRGDPNTSTDYRDAVEALFTLSWTLRFALKREGAVATLVLNRPDRRNSLSDAMLTDLGAALSMFGLLSLEQITAQAGAISAHVPAWVLLGGLVLLATSLVLARLEWTRLRGIALGQLLRR